LKTPHLILASSSRYRRELLGRLQLPFEAASPDIDETPLPGESPQTTACRLAEAKARALAQQFPDALIIGSDQVAMLGDTRLDKPVTHANAVAQLRAMRGKEAVFYTALCLYNSRSGKLQTRLIPYHVQFREFDDGQIERYLLREQPYDCAGSAKSEGLGIALIARMSGDDPNALVGLPLIALVEMLAAEGLQVI